MYIEIGLGDFSNAQDVWKRAKQEGVRGAVYNAQRAQYTGMLAKRQRSFFQKSGTLIYVHYLCINVAVSHLQPLFRITKAQCS
jgi:hypothetical protein